MACDDPALALTNVDDSMAQLQAPGIPGQD